LPEAVLSPENADQIRPLTRLGKGRVNALAYSSDGSHLAVGTTIGVVIYDTPTWSETLIETEDAVDTLAFSPAGDVLAVGLDNGIIQLLQAPDWSTVQTLVYNTVEPLTVEKSYWRGFYTGLDIQKNVGETENVLAFSPDGSLLAAGGDGEPAATGGLAGSAKFWRVADGTLLNTITVDGTVYDIAFHPDGRLLAISAWDLTQWPIPQGQDPEQLVPDFTYNISSESLIGNIAFTPDGKSLMGWSGDKVFQWQTANGQIVKSREVSVADRAQDLSADGKTLALMIDDFDRPSSLEIWDLESGARHPLQTKHADWIRSLALAPDVRTLAASFYDGTIQIIDTLSSEPVHVLDGFFPSVDQTQLKSNGKELLSLSTSWGPDLLQDWDLKKAINLQTIDLKLYGVTTDSKIAFSPDGSLMAVGNKNLQIWDFANKKVIRNLAGDQENYYSDIKDIAFSSDGDSIAYSSFYGSSIRLATISGDAIKTLKETISPGNICLFNDGRLLATGVQYWDTESDKLLKNIYAPYGYWSSFTPDCDLVASMSVDGHFRVMRNTSEKLGERVEDFDLRKEGIYLIPPAAFSPDHSLVAVQQAPGKIRIFSLETAETLAILDGHTEEITGLGFLPDGKTLVSSSRDGTIRLWGIHP
jgi:WD40 repeat protein